MREEKKHGPVKKTTFKPAEGKLMGLIQKIEKGLLPGEYVTYKKIIESGEWKGGIQWTRQLMMGLVRKGELIRIKPGQFRSILPKPKEERKISPEARKYLSLIDEKLKDLRTEKEKLQKEAEQFAKKFKQITSEVANLEGIKQELIRNPELAEIVEELKKL